MARASSAAKDAAAGKGRPPATTGRVAGGVGLDLGLFSAGGPFAAYAGPALVVGRNAVVLAANEAGQSLAELLKAGGGELRTAVEAALDGRPAQVSPLLLEPVGADGGEHAVDVAALPWGEGAAALVLGRDVTLERSLRHALMDSRARYKDLVEVSGDLAWETDADGRFAFVSPRGALGYAAAELVGRPAAELAPDDPEAAAAVFAARAPVEGAELWLRRADGAPACLVAAARPLAGETGWAGARGLCREVTEAREREAELARARHRERLLAYVLRIVREELEPEAMLAAAVEALLPALGLAGAAVYRRAAGGHARVAGAGAMPAEAALRERLAELDPGSAGGYVEASAEPAEAAADGRLLLVATRLRGQANGALCLWRGERAAGFAEDDRRLAGDLAAQLGVALGHMAREEELARLTATDPLTGLGNRRGFMERLDAVLRRGEGPAAVIYLDLDNFKLVNDRRGHRAGDEALQAVARLLRGEVRAGDAAARLGGDEFALLLAPTDAAAARRTGERLIASAASLADLTGDAARPLGLSVGVALAAPGAGADAAALLACADGAMYEAKRAGKGALVVAEAA